MPQLYIQYKKRRAVVSLFICITFVVAYHVMYFFTAEAEHALILLHGAPASSSSSSFMLSSLDTTTINLSVRNNVKPTSRSHNYAPIIIGAGQGTTGTHLFTEVTCHLGFMSMHYNLGCLQLNSSSILNVTVTGGGEHEEQGSKINEIHLFPLSTKLAEFERKQRSLIRHLRTIWVSPLSPASYRDKILALLQDIIKFGKDNNIVLALHDTPYPYLVSQILALVQKVYNGKYYPFILLSERDPLMYTKQRIKTHGSHIMCRNVSKLESGLSSNGFITESQVLRPLEESAFDVVGCIERALVSTEFNDTLLRNAQVGDLFEPMAHAYKTKGLDYVVKQVDLHQRTMREIADFTYNIFLGENKKTKMEELAEGVGEAMTSLNFSFADFAACSGNCLNMVNVNFWKSTIIDSLN